MAIIKPPPIPPLPIPSASLAERIAQVRTEIESLIEDAVAKESAMAPGVPVGVIRQMFNARYGKCACLAFEQGAFND
jgi:hypothetical protein